MSKYLGRKLAIGLVVFGAIGFFPFWIWMFPAELLNQIELPNALESARVTSPDGHVFVANQPYGRVQRYGPDGFERGFSVDTEGGVFDIGISPAGNIQICSVRTRALVTYSPDGVEIPPRWFCQFDRAHQGLIPDFHVYASQAKVPVIALNWLSTLAVPLWHPILAWVMMVAGGLYLKFNPRPRPDMP